MRCRLYMEENYRLDNVDTYLRNYSITNMPFHLLRY